MNGKDSPKRKDGNGQKAMPPSRELAISALLLAILGISIFSFDIVRSNLGLEERPVVFGATFSRSYAQSLGLDWRETYLAVLDDLGVRAIRIPAYWNDIEPSPGQYEFADLDWQVNEASRRGAKIVLAIGRKLPRWPECHDPSWVAGMKISEVQAKVLAMNETAVRRYKNNPAIVAWQVENEPFFVFGTCPETDRAFLKREVSAVRAIDKRPIMITESGELSTWIRSVGLADILGISTYRIVWNKTFGYLYWPLTPLYYRQRVAAVAPLVDAVVISELQAEPWVPEGIDALPIERQLEVMNPDRLRDNIIFARRIGLTEAYLWGVEWWYWLKKGGRPEMWEVGKTYIAEGNAERGSRRRILSDPR